MIDTATAAAALASNPSVLWPEPDWLRHAADELGYAWARVAWRNAASQPGAWFDAAKAEAVVQSWPRWFKLTVDRFFGKPFHLNAWQAVIVRLLVGWKIPDDVVDVETGRKQRIYVRLFRQLRLWVPRKNGKSEFLAALGILFFVFERIHGAEGYVFAKDEKQGGIPFQKMKVMLGLNPVLSSQITPFKKSIYVPEIQASIELLPGIPDGKHGRSPTVIVGDEMHEWRSRELSDTLRQGTGARLQPIELYASTAGLATNPVGTELYEESLAVIEGRSDDANVLHVIFAAGPEDDPFDEATWRKANPSLGVSPTLRFMRSEAAAARGNPRREAAFRCYHLGQWIDADVRWLPTVQWDACAKDRESWLARTYEAYVGRSCFVGMDLSTSKDLTALVFRFDPVEPGDPFELLCRFWIPEDSLAQRIKEDKMPWEQWARLGAVETTPGNYVDQGFVQKALREAVDVFDVKRIGYDRQFAQKLVGDLQKDGVDPELFLEIRQGIYSMGGGSRQLEENVYLRRIDHGGHPILRWNARNAVVRFDENLNFMPAKRRSRDKIDGIVAAVLCEVCALPPKEPEEVYDSSMLQVA